MYRCVAAATAKLTSHRAAGMSRRSVVNIRSQLKLSRRSQKFRGESVSRSGAVIP